MVELNAIHEVNNVVGGRYRLPMKLSVSVSYKGGETYKEKALVDTGNLIYSGVAISGTMARQLKLPIVPEQVVIGTAKKDSVLEVVGRARGMKIKVNGGGNFVVNPLVIKNLSTSINLGTGFLMREGSVLRMDKTGATVQIGSVQTPSQLIAEVSETVEQDRSRLSTRNRSGSRHREAPPVRNKGISAKTLQKVVIPKRTMARIEVVSPGEPEGTVYLEPVVGPSVQLCTAQHAVTKCSEGKMHIFMMNISEDDVTIPQGSVVAMVTKIKEVEDDKKESTETEVPGIASVSVNHDSTDRKKRLQELLKELKINENIMLTKNPKVKTSVIKLIDKYLNVFAHGQTQYGNTDKIEFSVKLKEGSKPVKSAVRPLNPDQRASLKQQLNDWEREGVIKKTSSPWASALVPVKKKDGSIRWAVDYRGLNSATIADSYPIPNMSEALEKLQGSRVYSSLDAASAYNTIRVEKSSQAALAFISPFGLYTFARMPFGARNAGATYSRFIGDLIDQLGSEYIECYLDDILIHTPDLESHVQQLEQVLQMHQEAGILLKAKKCYLFCSEVSYLGHRVNKQGISMEPNYIRRVMEWPVPKNVGQLRSFLGFTGYYRAYIKNYSALTNHLNSVKGKNAEWKWTAEMEREFNELKQEFAKSPLRAYPDFSGEEPFQVTTDWSGLNRAAILSQVQKGEEKFIGAVGKKNNVHEQNYSSTKGELHALLLGLRKWEHILKYRPFIVNTDSGALKYWQNLKNPRGADFRWLQELAEFQFTVKHRPGKLNTNADQLSRREFMPSEGEEDKHVAGLVIQEMQGGDLPPGIGMTRQKLHQAQKEDEVLMQVKQWLELEVNPKKEELRGLPEEAHRYAKQLDRLKVVDGVLYRVTPIENSRKKSSVIRKQLLVARDLRNDIFAWVHAHPTSGHFGQKATSKRALTYVYWPSLIADIAEGVRQCEKCVQKNRKINERATVHVPRVTGFPLEKMNVDLVGPFQTSKEGWRYILTCQDAFSRFAQCSLLKTKEAKEVTEVLYRDVICRYGTPLQLHSDNGTEFKNKTWKGLMQKLRIQVTNTPIYNPSSNAVERFHQVLNNIVRTYTKGDWSKIVSGAQLAYNTKVCEATNETPYKLFFGREAKLPLDIIVGLPEEEERTVPEYVKDIVRGTEEMYQRVRQHNKTIIRRNGYQYDGHTHEAAIPGALAWWYCPAVNSRNPKKLTNFWRGPYVIVERPGKTLAVIKPVNAEGPRMITNLTRLRVYHGDPIAVKGREIPDIEYEDEEDEYAEEIRSEVPETHYITIKEKTNNQQTTNQEQPYVEEKEHRLESPDYAPPDPGSPDPEPPDPDEVGERGIDQEGMELTQEGKEIIRKRDRSSSVEPGGQRQNKITKPLQGEKRDLQGHDSSDPEPPRKETRPVRKKARQVALDRALAQKMQDDAFALVADSSSESDLNQIVQSSVEESQSASIDVLVQQGSPIPQKNALNAGYDITAAATVTLAPQSVGAVQLNLKVKIPGGFYLQLAPLASLANKGLSVINGVFSAEDQQGPVQAQALVLNTTTKPFTIKRGQKITRGFLIQSFQANFKYV